MAPVKWYQSGGLPLVGLGTARPNSVALRVAFFQTAMRDKMSKANNGPGHASNHE